MRDWRHTDALNSLIRFGAATSAGFSIPRAARIIDESLGVDQANRMCVDFVNGPRVTRLPHPLDIAIGETAEQELTQAGMPARNYSGRHLLVRMVDASLTEGGHSCPPWKKGGTTRQERRIPHAWIRPPLASIFELRFL